MAQSLKKIEGNRNTFSAKEMREDYIKLGSIDHSFKAPSCQLEYKQLHDHDEIPELNYNHLIETAQAIFKGRNNLPLEEYRRLSKSFYESLQLGERGDSLELWDAYLLTKNFQVAHNAIKNEIEPRTRNKNMLVVGAGSGRLASAHIEIARMLGIEKIVFNDLYPHHLEKLQETIENDYKQDPSRIYGIDLQYRPGDIVISDLEEKFDFATAIWFVTSEIHDPSSPEACRKMRVEFYEKMRSFLIEGGILIEDLPDTRSIGKFWSLRKKTKYILTKAKILPGEEGNYSLTYVPKKSDGNPYHLRYAPYNGNHTNEIHAAGMNEYQNNTEPFYQTMPGIRYVMNEILKNIKGIEEAHRLLHRYTVEFASTDNDPTIQRNKQVCLIRETNV